MNINSSDRISSFSGMESTVDGDYIYFLTKLGLNNKLHHRIGVIGGKINKRLLGILGVKYFYENKTISYLTDVIPRFSAYSKMVSVTNLKDAVSKLLSKKHDFMKSVVFEGDFKNNIVYRNNNILNKLVYKITDSDNLHLNISSEQHRYILFNDRYNKSWKAFFNKKEIKVYKANGIFMGIVIPQGSGILELKFIPKNFEILTFISFISFLIFFLFSSLFFLFNFYKLTFK